MISVGYTFLTKAERFGSWESLQKMAVQAKNERPYELCLLHEIVSFYYELNSMKKTDGCPDWLFP